MYDLGAPPIEVKSPAAMTEVPETSSAETSKLFAFGSHAVDGTRGVDRGDPVAGLAADAVNWPPA